MLEAVSEFGVELASAFLRQVFGGFGALVLVATALFFVQRFTQRMLVAGMGWRAVVTWTGWLGVPVHELSHVIVAKLFRIKVVDFKLFQPDPRTGVLGYVRFVEPKLQLNQLHKVIGTFLMGVAPLFGGTLVLMLAFNLLIYPEADGRYFRQANALASLIGSGNPSEIGQGSLEFLRQLVNEVFRYGAKDPRPWLFMYITLAVGAHLAPSDADLENGRVGLLVILGLGLLANAIALLAGLDPSAATRAMVRVTGPLSALLLAALMLNLANLVVCALVALVASKLRKKHPELPI
jgi:hypothetical protein